MGSFGGGEKVKPTRAERQFAVIGDRKWKDYTGRLRPVVRKYNQKLAQQGSEADAAELTGRYRAGVQQGAGAAVNPGGNAGGGGFLAATIQQNLNRSRGLATAGTEAGLDNTARGIAARENIIQRGRNQQSNAVNTLQNRASRERAAEFSRAQTDAQNSIATGEALGTAAGLGFYKWKNPGKAAADPTGPVDGTATGLTGVPSV